LSENPIYDKTSTRSVNVTKDVLFKGEKIRIHERTVELAKDLRKITGDERYALKVSVPFNRDEPLTCMMHFKMIIYRFYRIIYISIYFYFFPFLILVLNYLFANASWTELVV
jgi:hypothetical protein